MWMAAPYPARRLSVDRPSTSPSRDAVSVGTEAMVRPNRAADATPAAPNATPAAPNAIPPAPNSTPAAPPISRISRRQAFTQASLLAPVADDLPRVVRRYRELAREAYRWHISPEVEARVGRAARVAPVVETVRAAALAFVRGRAAAAEGMSRAAQFRAMLGLRRAGVRAADFHRFTLHRVPGHERPFVVNYLEGSLVQKYLHRDADRLAVDDKLRLAAAARAAGLAVPPIVATVLGDEVGGDALAALATRLPATDLFAKRVDLGWGIGAMRFMWSDARRAWRDADGVERDAGSLARHLVETGRTGALVVQPRLSNGGSVAALTPGALATLRIVTLRARPGGAPELLGAALRMPASADAITDNFAGGGVAAPVVDRAGTLGAGATKASFSRRLAAHPATGAAIEGRRIDEFPAAVGLATRAHALFPDILSVGWDVAVTADGPVLVEGNVAWCPELMQQTSGRPLLLTPYGEACAAL